MRIGFSLLAGFLSLWRERDKEAVEKEGEVGGSMSLCSPSLNCLLHTIIRKDKLVLYFNIINIKGVVPMRF